MADANPVNTTPAKAGRWATLFRHRKAVLSVGGSGLLLAGGAYGYKYFTADPGRVVAQSDPPPVVAPAEPKPTEPAKRPDPAPDKASAMDLPEVPVVAPVMPPTTKPAELEFATLPPAPKPGARPADDVPLVLPPKPGDRTKDVDIPLDITPPPTPGKKLGDDDFKILGPATLGPGPLPTAVSDPKKEVKGPIVRIGGMDPDVKPPTPMKDEPPIPKLDLNLTDPPAPPAPDKKDGPPKPAAGPKPDDVPIINMPKQPKADDLPPLPKIDLDPPVTPVPPATAPRVDVPPAPVLGPMPTSVPPVKRDTFEEDWHTPTGRPDWADISRVHFKTADFARALEAYNRNRSEPFVRVPPTWVLEERFGTLIQKTETPGLPETKPVKFEPAAPVPVVPTGRRPAPSPAGPTNDEYKVTAPTGETIRDVAQKVLGNPNAWRQLQQLNPDIDPTLLIPAGTSLRLPR